MSLYEVNEAASLIHEEAHEDANIIFGAVIDDELAGEIRVTVIATGFGGHRREAERCASSYSPLEDASAAAIEDVPSRPFQPQPLPEVSTPEAPPTPPVEPQPLANFSTSNTSAPPPVELEPLQHVSIPEAPPPVASNSATLNGNSKARRLGHIKESILDMAAFKRRNGAQGVEATRIGQNGPPSLRPPRPPRLCKFCGAAELTETSAFCSKCGSSLRE
jgi:hypothetical protein